MKRFLFVPMALICLLSILLLAACGANTDPPKKGKEPTMQEQYDQAAQQEMDTYQFNFAVSEQELAEIDEEDLDDYVAWSDETLAKKTGEADSYIVCTDNETQETSLVYLYTDISYDSDSELSFYRYVDMYTPAPKDKLDPNTPVFLYLHGGGWIAGSRKDERLSLVPYLVKAGFVVFSMEYGLWFGMNQRPEMEKGVYLWKNLDVMDIIRYIMRNEHPVSVQDMMNDITACLTFLKGYLPNTLGLNCQNVGIGGYSAGGHLSSLYAYKYAETSPIPLAFELDLVGPVRLLDEGYLHVVSLVLGKDEQGNNLDLTDNENRFLITTVLSLLRSPVTHIDEMLQGILGADEPIDITTDEGWHKAEELIEQWQGYTFLSADSIPTVICYAQQHPESANFMEALFPDDFDLFVPITVYRSMSAKLDEVGIVHADRLYADLDHNQIGHATKSCKWMAEQCRAMAQLFCK